MKLNPLALMQKEYDRTGIVFDPEHNKALTLNRTGVAIWEAVDKGLNEEEIVAMMTDTFKVTEENAAHDVAAFLDSLRKYGLLAD